MDTTGLDATVRWTGNERIAMLLYPGLTILDLIGPQAMFGNRAAASIDLVARTLDPVTSDAGVTIVPTATFDSRPSDLTVLFAGGGTDGTLAVASDPATLAFLADRGSRATFVTSVCSGSLILGAAGLLEGYRATSHWSVRRVLSGYGAIPVEARVVRDRNRITGAGVTAGLDFALAMIAELRGTTFAEVVQHGAEYDPEPPFQAGSMRTAPARGRAGAPDARRFHRAVRRSGGRRRRGSRGTRHALTGRGTAGPLRGCASAQGGRRWIRTFSAVRSFQGGSGASVMI